MGTTYIEFLIWKTIKTIKKNYEMMTRPEFLHTLLNLIIRFYTQRTPGGT